MSSGPFLPYDKIYYWDWAEDQSKVIFDGSHGGKWIKGKLLTIEGRMAGIDLGTRIVRAK